MNLAIPALSDGNFVLPHLDYKALAPILILLGAALPGGAGGGPPNWMVPGAAGGAGAFGAGGELDAGGGLLRNPEGTVA